VSLRLLKQRQLKPGGCGLVRGAYPPLITGGELLSGSTQPGWEVTVNACGVAVVIFSSGVSRSCDLRHRVADTVIDAMVVV